MKTALIISALAFAGAANARTPIVQMPFSIDGGLPTVAASINDQPISLFIDLGGFSPVSLSKNTLSNVPVSFTGVTTQWRDASGAVYNSKGFVIRTLRLGDARFEDLNGVEFFGSGGATSRSGYIGLGFLERFLVVLDFQNRTFKLYAAGDAVAMNENCGNKTLPLKIVNGVVQSTFQTDLGDLIFQWDTGASENLIRPSAVGLSDGSKTLLSLSRLEMEGINFGRTVFSLREFRAPNVDGVLGAGFFESKAVCIDISNRRAAVK